MSRPYSRAELAGIAEALRESRVDHYDRMIETGKITESDAFRDGLARATIAADWTAIAEGSVRAEDPHCPIAWCEWALEQALTIQSAKARRDRPDRADQVAFRDGIELLLRQYRTRFVWWLLAFYALGSAEADRAAA